MSGTFPNASDLYSFILDPIRVTHRQHLHLTLIQDHHTRISVILLFHLILGIDAFPLNLWVRNKTEMRNF